MQIDTQRAAAIAAQLLSLNRRVTELEAEVQVSDELLATRNAFLDLLPACPQHGKRCLPYLTDWIQRLLVPWYYESDHGVPYIHLPDVQAAPGEPLIGHHGDLRPDPDLPAQMYGVDGFMVDLRRSARYERRLELWIGVPLTPGYGLRLAGQLTELLKRFYPTPAEDGPPTEDADDGGL